MKKVLSTDFVKDEHLRKSLNFVILGVCFGIVFFNTTVGTPIAGFAKELGFGDLLYAVMLALPVLGGAIQLYASIILERTKQRKLIFLISGFLNRIPWLFIAILPLIISNRIILFYIIVSLLILSSLGGAFLNVSFMSWMGDLVPLDIRGRFFSQRSMLATISSFISGLIIGKFLDTIPGIAGFSIVFILSTILGILDISCFFKVYDPPMKGDFKLNEKLSVMFKKVLIHPKFSKFLIFAVVFQFALNIAGPFFNLYMIKYLKMSFFEIALYVQLINSITIIFFVRIWGRIIDKFGNKPVLLISTTVISFLPFLWCLTTPDNWLFIIILIQILAGMFWPGVDLGYNNLALNLSPDENRSFYIAVLNLFVSSFGIALAYILGGFIVENIAPLLNRYFKNYFNISFVEYQYIFILSAILRFISSRFFLTKIEEEKAHSLKEIKDDIMKRVKKGEI
ncbi:MAG: MFS transporter [Dictyoglomaceae bacterium]|nr:MFS transporter [Dictyoglomaceae bacterium]